MLVSRRCFTATVFRACKNLLASSNSKPEASAMSFCSFASVRFGLGVAFVAAHLGHVPRACVSGGRTP
eukprot:10144016-Karenia_brevis.AAC.1